MHTTWNHSVRFGAMGTNAAVTLNGGSEELVEHLRWRLESLEANWSRFRTDSEVATLNRRAGEFVHVSSETFELVAKAAFAHQMTAGAFDPLLLGELCELGYDRTFDEVEANRMTPTPPGRGGGGQIALDQAERAVRIPSGAGFDPGGIGKGLAADLVSAEAIDAGADGVLVNLGGDLRVRGVSPDGGAWGIRLDEPAAGVSLSDLIAIGDGAVATSTTKKRAWGGGRHHLLDPHSGLPHSDGRDEVVLATVIAGDAWWADALTKACFADLDRLPAGVAALLVSGSGARRTFGGFDDYLRQER